LGTQRSPAFSKECFRAANAVRCARSPSPYSRTALSWVFIHVRWALDGDRLIVLGITSRAGMADTSGTNRDTSFMPRRWNPGRDSVHRNGK